MSSRNRNLGLSDGLACVRTRQALGSWLARWAAACLVGMLVAVMAGCGEDPGGDYVASESPGGSGNPDLEPVAVTDDEALRQLLDEVLLDTYENRHLSLEEHAAWQILHGVLAYQQDFQVERGGEYVSAVDHLLGGGTMSGWNVRPVIDTETGHRGLRAIVEAGSRTGQGHADQWLAVLAQCGLPGDQPIVVGGEEFTMADFVAQVQLDVPRNVEQEYSWTLIGLTSYLDTNTSWRAIDGREWSIERLMRIEAGHDLHASACGGTHRLIGMSMALNQHLLQGNVVSGGWSEADDRIQEAIELARRYQNADGSFSTNYLAGPGNSPDLAQNLGTTGHILEFLAISLTDDELREPWVRRAVVRLCEIFERTREIPLECGALYHAAHGLVLYRERMFGPRRYAEHPATPVASADDGT